MSYTTCPVCGSPKLRFANGYLTCYSCKAYKKRLNYFQRILAWAANKDWWWRAPIFIYFIYLFKTLLGNVNLDSVRSTPLGLFDMGVHEFGHFLFSGLGQFMHILGGSLWQCLFPLLWFIIAIYKKWYFFGSLSLCWLGLNFYDVAVYAGDARSGLLPLVSFDNIGQSGDVSDEVYFNMHDWHRILSRLHHLNWDKPIEHILITMGTICFVVGLVFAAVLLSNMIYASIIRRTSHTRS